MAQKTWQNEVVTVFSNSLSHDGSVNTPSKCNVKLPHPISLSGMEVGVRNVTFPTSWNPIAKADRERWVPRWCVTSKDGTFANHAQTGKHSQWVGEFSPGNPKRYTMVFTLQNQVYRTANDVLRQIVLQTYAAFPIEHFPDMTFEKKVINATHPRNVILESTQGRIWVNTPLRDMLCYDQNPNVPLEKKYLVTDMPAAIPPGKASTEFHFDPVYVPTKDIKTNHIHLWITNGHYKPVALRDGSSTFALVTLYKNMRFLSFPRIFSEKPIYRTSLTRFTSLCFFAMRSMNKYNRNVGIIAYPQAGWVSLTPFPAFDTDEFISPQVEINIRLYPFNSNWPLISDGVDKYKVVVKATPKPCLSSADQSQVRISLRTHLGIGQYPCLLHLAKHHASRLQHSRWTRHASHQQRGARGTHARANPCGPATPTIL